MSDILISIIVPVFNCKQALPYCVNSVEGQIVSDWELLLIDDGSTDGSGKLCDQFVSEDARIRVIHKENGGVSSARNAGIDAAAGEYITFCDSDDYLEPDYLELLLQTAKDNPESGHIWCCFQTVSGYQKESATPNYSGDKEILYFTLQEYMSAHELWLDTGPCNKLYHADIIKNNRIRFSEDLSLGEDWLFNLDYIDASENDRIAVVTKPLYNYVRGNSESLDSRYRSDMLDIYRRLNTACFSHLQKWNALPEQMEKFYNSRFYLYEKVLRNTMRAPDKSRHEAIEWNSTFMKSAEFREALSKRTCFVHPLYLAAYKSGNFQNVLYMDRLHEIKSAFTKK